MDIRDSGEGNLGSFIDRLRLNPPSSAVSGVTIEGLYTLAFALCAKDPLEHPSRIPSLPPSASRGTMMTISLAGVNRGCERRRIPRRVRDYTTSEIGTHLPTKFSSTELLPALWPPTTAICGRSSCICTPSCVNASCNLFTIGINCSIPALPAILPRSRVIRATPFVRHTRTHFPSLSLSLYLYTADFALFAEHHLKLLLCHRPHTHDRPNRVADGGE